MIPGGTLPGLTDLHSHLVPGVDDGAATVEDALEGIGRMIERGVSTIVTTPHLTGSLVRTPDALEERISALRQAFDQLQPRVASRFPELRFELGCEIMLDRPDLDLSHTGLRLGSAAAILVEWPSLHVPPETPPVLASLRRQGVEVLVAHPERYSGYDAGMSVVPRWREEGAVLQMNHGSLLGRYGPVVRERAFRMLEAGWIDCLSTDFHGRPALRLFIREAHDALLELGADEAWNLLARTNPARFLAGERPLPVPPIRDSRGLVRRLLSRIRS